jgi:hypothetical protein
MQKIWFIALFRGRPRHAGLLRPPCPHRAAGIAAGIRRGADTHRYALYLDTDLNPASGCSVSAINASRSYTEVRPR